MTIDDAVKMWLQSHNLKMVHATDFAGYTCKTQTPRGKWIVLSNNMHMTIAENGDVGISSPMSKKSYMLNIADPHLFQILDRAIDEEDKWIREGHRVPDNGLGSENNRKTDGRSDG